MLEMQISPLNTSLIASNALTQGANKINTISQSINHSLVEQNQTIKSTTSYPEPNYSALNNSHLNNNSLETNLIGLTGTKNQMLALMKVLEVQNNVDQSLGKVFDSWS